MAVELEVVGPSHGIIPGSDQKRSGSRMFWIQNKFSQIEFRTCTHQKVFIFFILTMEEPPSAEPAALFASIDNAVTRELEDLMQSFSPPSSQNQEPGESR